MQWTLCPALLVDKDAQCSEMLTFMNKNYFVYPIVRLPILIGFLTADAKYRLRNG